MAAIGKYHRDMFPLPHRIAPRLHPPRLSSEPAQYSPEAVGVQYYSRMKRQFVRQNSPTIGVPHQFEASCTSI